MQLVTVNLYVRYRVLSHSYVEACTERTNSNKTRNLAIANSTRSAFRVKETIGLPSVSIYYIARCWV